MLVTFIRDPAYCNLFPVQVNFLLGGKMPDSMTFRARDRRVPCKLCSADAGVLEFDIQCGSESSGQSESCCPRCARNLLEALIQVAVQSVT